MNRSRSQEVTKKEVNKKEVNKKDCTSMVIGGKYKIVRRIGGGSFGEIYLGLNLLCGENVAIKMESATAQTPQLQFEYKLYTILRGGCGIANARYFGREQGFNVMVMDLLGPSLEDMFNYCCRSFTIKTVLMLADQLLHRLEFVHNKSFVHCDIKPDNMVMGVGVCCTKVFLIDFGLAKKFRDPFTRVHIPCLDKKKLIGTARYASLNAHLGIELARRDDLESLGFVFIYFIRGALPWQGLHAVNKEQKYERISEKKLSTTVEALCQNVPEEFAVYFRYCRNLRFAQNPDYAHLRRIFKNLFKSLHHQYDNNFDWALIKQQERLCLIQGRGLRTAIADGGSQFRSRFKNPATFDVTLPIAAFRHSNTNPPPPISKAITKKSRLRNAKMHSKRTGTEK